MITRVLLLLILTLLPFTATAENPQLWENTITLINRRGYDVIMPPYLMEFFQFPQPENIKGKEIKLALWEVAVFQPEGHSKPMILVRYLPPEEILPGQHGVDAKKGIARLLDHEGKLEQSCQWVDGKVVWQIMEVQERKELELFKQSMQEYLKYTYLDPQFWMDVMALAEKKSFSVTLPPDLMEYFRIPRPAKIEGKEVTVPQWLMTVFGHPVSQKKMILVRRLLGDPEVMEYGVGSTKGVAWLLDEFGKEVGNCQWDGKIYGPIAKVYKWDNLDSFIRTLERWKLAGGMIDIPREDRR